MVKRYYYEYHNNLMSIKVENKFFNVNFLTDNTSRIFYNRVNFIGKAIIGNDSVIELMPDGSYLTADGTKFEFDSINLIIKITHTQDDSYIMCYADSSIEVYNNGFLPDYEDDKHRKLSPKIISGNLSGYSFSSKFSTNVRIAKLLAAGSIVRASFPVYTLASVQGLPMAQVVGQNNSYSVLTDDKSQVLSCLTYDYTHNPIDSMFGS